MNTKATSLLKACTVCFVYVAMCLPNVAVSQEAPPAKEQWPPSWVEGAWKRGEVEVSVDGIRSDKTFLFADYYLFISGHRYSIYKDRRVRATPTIGHSVNDEVSHCLFNRRENVGSRAHFTSHGDSLEYVSYIKSGSDRHRLSRHLKPVEDQDELLAVLERALEREYIHVESESAREILDNWIRDQRNKMAQNVNSPFKVGEQK